MSVRITERRFRDTWQLITTVEGWLTEKQAHRLWRASHSLSPGGRIVEIGSFRGRSTIVLALAAGPEVEIFAIDPHLGSDRGPREISVRPELGQADNSAFHSNLEMAAVSGRVRHVRLPSQEALDRVDGAVDLLYVDGAHRVAPALADLRLWGARVPIGGRMLVHDAFSSVGVTVALARAVIGAAEWHYLGRSGSLAEYQRVELDADQRIIEALRGLAQLPFFARNLLVKLMIVARLRSLARLLGHREGPWPY
jgi:Methyltransferase domain